MAGNLNIGELSVATMHIWIETETIVVMNAPHKLAGGFKYFYMAINSLATIHVVNSFKTT